MNLEEKTINSRTAFEGKVIDVLVDDVVIATGQKTIREVVKHKGGVVIIALKDDMNILMVKQYRYPIREESLELPAGKLDIDEDPAIACKRELEEETGYVAQDWKSLGYIYTSPGFCNEKLYLYLATNLKYVGDNPDEGEVLQTQEYKAGEIFDMIKNGEINDAKTICAMSRAFSGGF